MLNPGTKASWRDVVNFTRTKIFRLKTISYIMIDNLVPKPGEVRVTIYPTLIGWILFHSLNRKVDKFIELYGSASILHIVDFKFKLRSLLW
jgi:hypothetical protein